MLWCLYHIPEFRYLRKKGRRGKKRIRPLSFSIKQAFSFNYIQATTSFWSLSTSCRGSFSLQAASMDFLMFLFIYLFSRQQHDRTSAIITITIQPLAVFLKQKCMQTSSEDMHHSTFVKWWT